MTIYYCSDYNDKTIFDKNIYDSNPALDYSRVKISANDVVKVNAYTMRTTCL